MGKKIVLIGAGNVGSRHLQALAHLPYNLRIQVVEPDPQAQDRARNILKNESGGKFDVNIEWSTRLDNVYTCPDLTIVATTSKGRVDLIEKLITIGHKRLLIEKVVCQSKDEYDHLLSIVSKNDAKAWVDCTYRYYPYFIEIGNLLEGKSAICFSVVGSNNGLGCNAIHFIDIFRMISGNNQSIELDGYALDKKIMSCPRGEDFVEFTGLITAKTDNGNCATINFHPEIPRRSLLITVLAQGIKIFIEDRGALAKIFISREENDWQWEDYDYGDIVVSKLTTHIAQSILESDECNLPKVEDLYQIHNELFRIFNNHIKAVTKSTVSVCPIT